MFCLVLAALQNVVGVFLVALHHLLVRGFFGLFFVLFLQPCSVCWGGGLAALRFVVEVFLAALHHLVCWELSTPSRFWKLCSLGLFLGSSPFCFFAGLSGFDLLCNCTRPGSFGVLHRAAPEECFSVWLGFFWQPCTVLSGFLGSPAAFCGGFCGSPAHFGGGFLVALHHLVLWELSAPGCFWKLCGLRLLWSASPFWFLDALSVFAPFWNGNNSGDFWSASLGRPRGVLHRLLFWDIFLFSLLSGMVITVGIFGVLHRPASEECFSALP